MNAQELYLKDGTSTGVHYCGECRNVWREHADAERCCKPNVCACGAECERYWTSCIDCIHRARAERDRVAYEAAATKTNLRDYDGEHVYVEGDDAPILVDELLDRLAGEIDGPTEYVYACRSEQLHIDVDNAIEHALQDAYDGAESDIPAAALTELREYVDKWCSLNMPLVYWQDPKHALVIDTPRDA